MSRKKRKNTQLTAGRMLAIAALFPLAIVAYLVITENSPVEPRPHARRAPEPTSVETMIEANAAMNRDFEEWFAIAAEVAGDHPHARTLIEFANSHAVPSALQPGGATRFLLTLLTEDDVRGVMERLNLPNPTLEHPRSFEITVADMALRRSYGVPAIWDWQFSQERNELFVPPRRWYSRTYGAIVLLHELQHAYDICTGAAPDHASDREWAQGEARAYAVELAMVDRHTHGEASRFGRSLVDHYRRPGDTRWIWPSDMPDLGPVLARFDEILGEPASTRKETETRGGTLLILMNRELASREGLSDEDFLAFLLFTRSLPS